MMYWIYIDILEKQINFLTPCQVYKPDYAMYACLCIHPSLQLLGDFQSVPAPQ